MWPDRYRKSNKLKYIFLFPSMTSSHLGLSAQVPKLPKHASRTATYAMAKGDGQSYRSECSSMALETAQLSAWRWRRHMQAGHQAPSSCKEKERRRIKEEEAALVRHEVAVAELLQAQAPPVDQTKETATASSSNTAAEGKSKSKGKGKGNKNKGKGNGK